MKKNILFFILGALIFGGIGVIAANTIWAADITYTKEDDTKVIVQKAVDDLYKMSSSTTGGNKITINGTQKSYIPASENDTFVGVVYFDPTDLSKDCSLYNNLSGTNTMTGCMKWYIYDKDATHYGLLVDHNISRGDFSSTIETFSKLTTNHNWKVTPELISGADIAKITGKTDYWSVDDANTWYYFDSTSEAPQTRVLDSNNKSKYSWLFDNIYCEGCYNSVNNASDVGYLTKEYTCDASSRYCESAWYVWKTGGIVTNIGYPDTAYVGLRPIVVVSK